MKIARFFAALLVSVAVMGCAHKHDYRHDEDSKHNHNDKLQLAAYSDEFEIFAEADPFVTGEPSDMLVYITSLKDFKPLTSGKVTASLVIGTDGIRQTAEAPIAPGIYRFALTPGVKGRGKMIFQIRTERGEVQNIVPNVKVYDDKHEALHAASNAMAVSSNGVSFAKEMSWRVDFSTESCRREPFGQVIRTMAQIQPSQNDECAVTAKSSGIITFADNRMADGKEVCKGQTLFYIESDDMTDNNLSVRYREAESNYNLAKKEYERKKELEKDKIVSESDLLQSRRDYETAEAVYKNLRKNFTAGRQSIAAPIGGFVKQLSVRNGEYVEAGQTITAIAQNRNLFIKAELQPKYYAALEHVTGAHFRIPNDEQVYSLEELKGRLIAYGKSVAADSPLLPVIFQIDNSVKLLPGSFVEMYIKTQGANDVITVPNESLVEEMGNHFVYVQLSPVFFEKREVKIGATDGRRTEICIGLKEDERIVVKGAVLVKLAQATGTLDAHSGHVH